MKHFEPAHCLCSCASSRVYKLLSMFLQSSNSLTCLWNWAKANLYDACKGSLFTAVLVLQLDLLVPHYVLIVSQQLQSGNPETEAAKRQSAINHPITHTGASPDVTCHNASYEKHSFTCASSTDALQRTLHVSLGCLFHWQCMRDFFYYMQCVLCHGCHGRFMLWVMQTFIPY